MTRCPRCGGYLSTSRDELDLRRTRTVCLNCGHEPGIVPLPLVRESTPRAHRTERATVQRVCQQCGVTYFRESHKHQPQRYCSPRCAYLARGQLRPSAEGVG